MNSVVIGSLFAQQYVEDIPALATTVASSWLLLFGPAVSCRDAIPIDQPLTRLGAVRHQELDLSLRGVAAIDHIALGIRRKAGHADTDCSDEDCYQALHDLFPSLEPQEALLMRRRMAQQAG